MLVSIPALSRFLTYQEYFGVWVTQTDILILVLASINICLNRISLSSFIIMAFIALLLLLYQH